MSYDVKLGYCFSTHFDNLLFCDLIPFCVFGLVGISFKKDKCPRLLLPESDTLRLLFSKVVDRTLDGFVSVSDNLSHVAI